MKNLLVILTMLHSSLLLADYEVQACKQAIAEKSPYTIYSWDSKPIVSVTRQTKSIKWDYLSLIYSDGKNHLGSVKCSYNTLQKTVIFLQVYDANVISPHESIISKLKTASKEEAKDIALSLGISEESFEWLRQNGRRGLHGIYNPTGEIIGLPIMSKKELKKLDDLFIISLYPQNIDEQYLSISTELSEALSERL